MIAKFISPILVDADASESDGHSGDLRAGASYFVHAIIVDSLSNCVLCIREPNRDILFPYFYSSIHFSIIDSSLPLGYGMAIRPDRKWAPVLIAPTFWIHDDSFYEKLSNAHPDDNFGAAGIFKQHLLDMKALCPPDTIV